MPPTITSRDNLWFKRFREAAREHREEIVLEGPKQIATAIQSGLRPRAIGGTADSLTGFAEFRRLLFSEKLLESISDAFTPQKLLALFPRPVSSAAAIFARRGPVVVLERVQDPANVGAIIRSAAAFNAAGVVLTADSADPWSGKALRAAAGATVGVVPARCPTAEVLELIRGSGRQLCVTAEGAAPHVPEGELVIVFGNEGSGVSEAYRESAVAVGIRTSGKVESLNVAAAAAILLSKLFDASNG
jgi:TrmH family RNA methyltransferase